MYFCIPLARTPCIRRNITEEALKMPQIIFKKHVLDNFPFPVLLCDSLWKHYTYWKPEWTRSKQTGNLIRSMKHFVATGFTFSGFPYWSMDIQGEAALGCRGWLQAQAERCCVTAHRAWCPLLASASLAAWRLDLQQQYPGSYPAVFVYCLTTDLTAHNIS